MAPSRSSVRGGSRRIGLLLVGHWNQAGFATLLKPITFAANVDRGRVMQQTVEDGCGDDRITEDRAPLAVAFIRGQNDAASFVTSADQLEEDRRSQIVERQIAHFIDDEDL